MKIAFFHNHPSGGAARAMHELGRRLSSRHQIDVYHLTSADEQMFPSAAYARTVTSLPFAERPPIRGGLYLNEWRRYSDLNRLEEVCRMAAAAIDNGAHDVVFVNSCRFLQTPSVLPYLSTPSVYYCHEPPRRFTQAVCREDGGPLTLYQRLRASWHRPAKKLIDSVIARRDRRNFAAAGAVLTNSSFTASQAERHYGRNPAVCRLGVDTERLLPSETRAGDYVISVGALEPHKGFDFLVRTIGLLAEAVRPELVIVSNWANPGVEKDLRRLARANGVSMRLMVAVTEDELLSLYQQARVFAYAPHEEPFGLAVLEAMACGLPAVAVAEGGVMETVRAGETGLLVPRDEAAFARALASILSDNALARSMGTEGRHLAVTDWTWEAAAVRLEEHLAGAAARREPKHAPRSSSGAPARTGAERA